MDNPMERLWNSTADLYQRFDLDAPMPDRVRKFKEEVQEFLDEVRAFDYGNGSGIALEEEAVDVIVTIIGILQKRGVRPEWLWEEFEKVAQKNDAKTLDTHVIHDGLITRRSKLNGTP